MQVTADTLNRELSTLSAEVILRRCVEEFGEQVVFASSLGLEDGVILDLIVRNELAIPTFTLDTGRLFPQTYDLIERIHHKYGTRIRILFPEAAAVESLVNEGGPNLFREGVEARKACCRVRKIEPLRRALSGNQAWICGLRRDQSVTREELDVVEWDEGNGLIKVNPLASWGLDQVQTYIQEHKVPVNPLHAQGFPSIGCACCTRAIKPGEDIRAGRWWWENPENKECGLHLHSQQNGSGI
ncbi:MAG: phosphoadenylyl-sulfate reductase [Planctomycetota bacterium]|jgi:phosphoadenosine phosphosulfate reductase